MTDFDDWCRRIAGGKSHSDPCACGHRRGLHTGDGATRTAHGTLLDDGACVGPINASGHGSGCTCRSFELAARRRQDSL